MNTDKTQSVKIDHTIYLRVLKQKAKGGLSIKNFIEAAIKDKLARK